MTDKKRLPASGRIIAFVIMAAVVIADQLTKAAAVKELVHVGNSTTAIPGVLDFTYVLNSGATAGILSGHRWIFMVISAVVIIAASVVMALGRIRYRFTAYSLALIVGGGIGNMIDRVARGKVVDFINVTFVDFFPFNTVFNVADMCVCIGCALLVLSVIVSEIKERKEHKDAAAGAEEEREDQDGI